MFKDIENKFKEKPVFSSIDDLISNLFKFNDMPIVIGLTGYDKCGKTYVANELKKRLKNSKIINLADPLKETAAFELNYSLETLERKKDNNEKILINGRTITVREYLIELANKIRKFDDEYFINNVIKRINKDISTEVFIIPDIRFEIEDFKLRMNFLNYNLIRIISNLETCGKNGLRYEVDKLNPDAIYINLKEGGNNGN